LGQRAQAGGTQSLLDGRSRKFFVNDNDPTMVAIVGFSSL
jgi:hypothetical protein